MAGGADLDNESPAIINTRVDNYEKPDVNYAVDNSFLSTCVLLYVLCNFSRQDVN